jgi:hypothetical protein
VAVKKGELAHKLPRINPVQGLDLGSIDGANQELPTLKVVEVIRDISLTADDSVGLKFKFKSLHEALL